MTATETEPVPRPKGKRPSVKPRAGEQFRAVARLPIEGQKRRKLLALIAAYADAGEPSPTVKMLAAGTRLHFKAVDRLLHLLEEDGLLAVQWVDAAARERRERNVYRVLVPGAGEAVGSRT